MRGRSGSTVAGAALKRLKITGKKMFFHPKVDEKACCLFKRQISVYEQMKISVIYIDESGFIDDMPRKAQDVLESMTGRRTGGQTQSAH